MRILECLSEYIFREKRYTDILEKQTLKLNMYAKNIENEEIVNLKLERFIGYLQPINLVFLLGGGAKESFHPYDILSCIPLKKYILNQYKY